MSTFNEMTQPPMTCRLETASGAAFLYWAEVVRVIDGDTIDLLVDVGFDIRARVRVRIAGVNTPEVRGSEREEGLRSKRLVEVWCFVGSKVLLKSYKGKRSFSRWVGDVAFSFGADDGAGLFDLAASLIAVGAGEVSKG